MVIALGLSSFLRAAPIHSAAETGDVSKLRAIVAANPAAINAKNDDGLTALWLAAQKGKLEAVTFLLENGADVDPKSDDGVTPLWIAAQQGYVEVVKALLAKNADIEAKRADGVTPLYMAADNGQIEVVKVLLAKGANPNVVAGGVSARQAAEKDGNKDIVELLLAAEKK